MFTIQHKHLQKLCEVNSYPVPNNVMVFFGFRGCLPVDAFNHDFRQRQDLNLTPIDYASPRCTLGQWLPANQTLAVFPGSTAPCKTYIEQGTEAANMLMTGFYDDYRKGKHKATSPTGHAAFKQIEGCPVRRDSHRDFKFDELDDRVEYDFSLDNIHAGWCTMSSTKHAGAGCQVVVGFPKCQARGNQPESGPWKSFRETAYALAQDRFAYVLGDGLNILEVVQKMDGAIPIPARLRFGSHGPLVTEVQKALKDRGFYEGNVDQDYGNRTLRAVLAFQQTTFGKDQDNGIVGPLTSEALGLKEIWPTF